LGFGLVPKPAAVLAQASRKLHEQRRLPVLLPFLRLSSAVLFLLASGGALLSAAEAPAEPVAALYRAAAAVKQRPVIQDKKLRKQYFTSSFEAVMASIDKREDGTGESVLDFDPVLSMNGDGDASALVIKTLKEAGDHAQVTATFGRGTARRAVAYALMREAGTWRIDDITSAPDTNAKEKWSVRKISDDDLAIRRKVQK
jgi:hypothetical protein